MRREVSTALEQATALLVGDLKVPVHSVRAAAWVTRAALEKIIHDLLRAKGCESGRASTRSLLGCLEVLYDDKPDIATSAQYAWDALSRACHHHAFELAPTYAEVSALITLVRRLDDTSSTISTSAL